MKPKKKKRNLILTDFITQYQQDRQRNITVLATKSKPIVFLQYCDKSIEELTKQWASSVEKTHDSVNSCYDCIFLKEAYGCSLYNHYSNLPYFPFSHTFCKAFTFKKI